MKFNIRSKLQSALHLDPRSNEGSSKGRQSLTHAVDLALHPRTAAKAQLRRFRGRTQEPTPGDSAADIPPERAGQGESPYSPRLSDDGDITLSQVFEPASHPTRTGRNLPTAKHGDIGLGIEFAPPPRPISGTAADWLVYMDWADRGSESSDNTSSPSSETFSPTQPQPQPQTENNSHRQGHSHSHSAGSSTLVDATPSSRATTLRASTPVESPRWPPGVESKTIDKILAQIPLDRLVFANAQVGDIHPAHRAVLEAQPQPLASKVEDRMGAVMDRYEAAIHQSFGDRTPPLFEPTGACSDSDSRYSAASDLTNNVASKLDALDAIYEEFRQGHRESQGDPFRLPFVVKAHDTYIAPLSPVRAPETQHSTGKYGSPPPLPRKNPLRTPRR